MQKRYWRCVDWTALLSIVGFVMGLCWIIALSSEIIGALKAVGKALHVSNGILGVTVFAFGNCVGDYATNVMISRLGFYSMATGASWAGPMMSMLLNSNVQGTIILL
jgi:sodium/potassium/calcium exchanger 6